MRPIITSTLLLISIISYAQIHLEEITAPVDFSIYNVRKSPTGEYFTQASNDHKSIYSSLDGSVWTKDTFPKSYYLDDMLFFSDGTPFLKNENLVRRNGIWFPLGSKEICIKNDTLFYYAGHTFGYSVDKGETFDTLCTITEDNIGIISHFWKFNNYLVLTHASGISDDLSVFTMDGQQVLYADLALNGGFASLYNESCEQAHFFDHHNFYLLKEDGLELTHGDIKQMFPYDAYYAENVTTVNGSYFIREGNTIYKSDGCGSSWEVFAQDDRVEDAYQFWISANEELILITYYYNNLFVEHSPGSATWDEHQPNINYPFLVDANQVGNENQFALTTSSFFHKKVNESQWTKTDSLRANYAQCSYAPNGDLYIHSDADTVIRYSQDNGITFKNIELPSQNPWSWNYFKLYVLDNKILCLISNDFGDVFYSLNNGIDWIEAPINAFLNYPTVKLVDNYIYIGESDLWCNFYRISVVTNEVISAEFPDLSDQGGNGMVILDDGTFYFHAWDHVIGGQDGIFRFRFKTGLEFLPELTSLAEVGNLYSSGYDLYGFTRTTYEVYDGISLQTSTISGLPSTGSLTFWVTDDEYLFAFLGTTRIFRSTAPLSITQTQYITGNLSYDKDKDCITGISNEGIENWEISVENDHFLRMSSFNDNGDFNFTVPKGNYTLSCKPITSNWDVCENFYPITIDDQHLSVNQDILAYTIASCAELELDFSTPLLRRCFDNTYTIRIRNFGPEASIGTTLTLKLDSLFEIVSATLPYTLVNDHTVIFDLGELPLNETITFQVIVKVSCDAALGAEHCLTGILNSHNLCGSTRSSYTECQTNIGSYDPNDKRTFNEQGDETTRVEKGEFIYYHIRFQNTGTDTAFTVRLVDPLSPMLDLSTLEMLSSSHPYTYEITDGPDLSVTFNNILLVDSTTNEPLSHGFVKFRVKPLPEFDYGTVIPNKAGIFFDFNAPVLTNQADLTIAHAVGTKDIRELVQFDLFPNPTNSSLHFALPDQYIDRVDSYEIMDVMGRLLKTGHINGNAIDVSDLPPGIYNLVLVQNDIRIGQKKFAKT